ncbi:UvrD-helicase domain-containing protein [Methylotenera sp.]|uniref:UvrD-helicase domain-containing protein n=1 Tax=Methylotenera sp. TaxID=2051956 RepID=UPI0027308F0D|nr:UvrD-helicase domain-containing protein [Methylotenera sp.]MDP2070101.1 UvrD-helicase domain-containing protein [Methylotenera sp.]MDP3006447.1 UvrD-helicase domain-containing protein [Methylotenera sp.]
MNIQNSTLTQDPLLAGLNNKQLEAVTLPQQSALILAGAGSGKTRVLTARIAWLIQTGQVSPTGLLAVTFTNKAAKEMLTRITASLPINTRGMWVGTFHGLCNRLLRAHHREAGLPQSFQILDIADQLSVIKRLMKLMNVDDEKFPPKQVQNFINGCKDEGLRAHAVEAYDPHSVKMREIFEEYDKQCQRDGVADFAELLLRCYELLERDANIRQHYQSRFKYILVDEFQDTNRLQYLWLKLLAGKDNCMFAVGDDDQSIYGFRGAHVGNMRDFEKDFNIQHIVKLEENYRSHSNILDAANAIISHNTNRLGKNLWTAAGAGEPVRVYDAYNDTDEAQFIVDEIKMLHCEGTSLGDIALLYRSNAQSRILEHALFSANLPYRVYGGLRFFERAEIKHALAYMRLIANANDDTALLRVINFPTRGIGARSLEQLQESARAANCSIWQAAVNKVGHGKLGGKGIEGFVALIRHMVDNAYGICLSELTELAITMSGLTAHYENDKEGEDRIENLKELVTAAVSFTNQDFGNHNNVDGETEQDLLTQFLSHASLEAGEHQADVGREALQLMTVHASKGLEFKAVFISGLEEGLCPHEQSLFENSGLEEERRLMYVAVTRARQRLYLSHAQSRMLHGKVRYGIPSRFLDEIPEELLKRLNSKPIAKSGYGRDYNELPAMMSKQQSNQQKSAMPWKIGQQVAHAKFGNGVVVSYEGNANDMRVQVNFGREGLKWLAMEFAKLSPI